MWPIVVPTKSDSDVIFYLQLLSKRISSDKASNLPKRDVRFILLK